MKGICNHIKSFILESGCWALQYKVLCHQWGQQKLENGHWKKQKIEARDDDEKQTVFGYQCLVVSSSGHSTKEQKTETAALAQRSTKCSCTSARWGIDHRSLRVTKEGRGIETEKQTSVCLIRSPGWELFEVCFLFLDGRRLFEVFVCPGF